MSELSTLAIFCGSNPGKNPTYTKAAFELGKLLAKKRIKIVYGGGKVGLMGILADASLDEGGEVVGIITDFLLEKEVGHNALTELVVVGSMHERKALMEQRSNGFIILPGGFGTLDEFAEIFTWSQLGLHTKPIGVLNVNGYFNLFLAFIDHMVNEGFLKKENKNLIIHSDSPEDLIIKMNSYSPEYTPKWMDSSDT